MECRRIGAGTPRRPRHAAAARRRRRGRPARGARAQPPLWPGRVGSGSPSSAALPPPRSLVGGEAGVGGGVFHDQQLRAVRGVHQYPVAERACGWVGASREGGRGAAGEREARSAQQRGPGARPARAGPRAEPVGVQGAGGGAASGRMRRGRSWAGSAVCVTRTRSLKEPRWGARPARRASVSTPFRSRSQPASQPACRAARRRPRCGDGRGQRSARTLAARGAGPFARAGDELQPLPNQRDCSHWRGKQLLHEPAGRRRGSGGGAGAQGVSRQQAGRPAKGCGSCGVRGAELAAGLASRRSRRSVRQERAGAAPSGRRAWPVRARCSRGDCVERGPRRRTDEAQRVHRAQARLLIRCLHHLRGQVRWGRTVRLACGGDRDGGVGVSSTQLPRQLAKSGFVGPQPALAWCVDTGGGRAGGRHCCGCCWCFGSAARAAAAACSSGGALGGGFCGLAGGRSPSAVCIGGSHGA